MPSEQSTQATFASVSGNFSKLILKSHSGQWSPWKPQKVEIPFRFAKKGYFSGDKGKRNLLTLENLFIY